VASCDRSGAVRPVDRPVRLARSTAAALVCVITAAAAHHDAGGPLPAWAVASAFAASGAVAWLLSSRRIRPAQLLGLLILCQVGLHFVTASDQMVMGHNMIAAHAGATIVSLVALSYGEALAWEVLERLGLRLLPLLRRTVVVPSLRPPHAVVAPRSLRDLRLTHSRWLRGPPVGFV
jgi:hypothetical protein